MRTPSTPARPRAAAGAFWRYWTGSTVSLLGDAVTAVALPLTAVTVLHASGLEVGLVTAAGYAAWVIIGLPAGVLVGRLPLRGTQVAMDLIRAAALLSVPVAGWFGVLGVPQLVLTALAVSTASVVFDIGNSTLLPSIVPADELTARNSLTSASVSATQLCGPALGGALVQLIGAATSLLFDVGSYLVSAVLLRTLPRPSRLESPKPAVSVRQSIREGWTFVTGHPVIRPCVLDATAVNFVCGGLMALTPVFLIRTLHASPALVGVLIATEGAGSLVGASLTPRLSRRLGSARAVLLGASAMPPLIILMPAASAGWGLLLFAAGNAGFAGAVVVTSILTRTHRQTVTPPGLLPRVMATVRFVSWGAVPLGALSCGAAASWLGPRTALWLACAVVVLAPAAVWASPVRKLRELADAPAADAQPDVIRQLAAGVGDIEVCGQDNGHVAFATDDLTAWLIGMLADVARGKLAGLIFGGKLERALSSATRETVQRTAEEVYPEDQEKAGDVALAIGEVFGAQVPAGSLAGGETTLELLRAGVARQLAVLDDPELTGTGQSSADVLGVRAGVLAEKLADNLVSAIIAGGSRGGPLFPLANQLNHDLTHLDLELWDDRARLRGGGDAGRFGQIQSGTQDSQPADGQPPLFITATVGATHYRSDDWIVDVPLDELARWNSSGPPVGEGRLQMWAFEHHLRSADNNCLELTVEGRTAQAVVLKQVRFHVLNRRPGSVPRGVRLDLSRLSLGSSLNVRNFEVDLGSADVATPAAMPLGPYESRLTPDFPYVVYQMRTPDFPYVVHRTDPERFYFSLDYGDEDVEWVAMLDWLSAGRSGSVRIDDAGAPFASTAFRSRPVYIWNASHRREHLCADEGCYRNHHRSRK